MIIKWQSHQRKVTIKTFLKYSRKKTPTNCFSSKQKQETQRVKDHGIILLNQVTKTKAKDLQNSYGGPFLLCKIRGICWGSNTVVGQ